MVNRENIKSKIDKLPEDIILNVDNYIKKQIKKSKNNAEYLAKLDLSLQQLKEGKTVTFEWEEFEAMTKMPPDEAKAFCEKIRARGKK